MQQSVGVVRGWEVVEADDEPVLNAASLVKQVVAHVALAVLDDLEESVLGEITAAHVLTHTTGLPNWRPAGEPLVALRPAGTRWGYSGEGFVLLKSLLELRSGSTLDRLVDELVFGPLQMTRSYLGEAEEGFHGYQPLMTTGADYARFLAASLRRGDEPFEDRWVIDDELAWSAGWGLQLGPPLWCWQWGSNDDAASFVIGCPSTGDGVVVLTDDPNGHEHYRPIVQHHLPGDHPALRLEHNETWLNLFG